MGTRHAVSGATYVVAAARYFVAMTKGKLARRLWHICGGSVFPLLSIFLPLEKVLIALYAVTAVVVALEAVRLAAPALNRRLVKLLSGVIKARERSVPTGTTFLLIASVIAFTVFDAGIAALALFFVAVGDPAAATVGERFGSKRYFGKSLEGSAGGFAACVVVGVLLSQTVIDVPVSVVLAGASAAMVVELLPLPLDDNLSIPLASAGVMALLL